MIGFLRRWHFRRRLIAAVMGLPELPRAVFIDCAHRGLSYDQIAAKRDLHPQDVKLLLRTALIDLQESLYPDEPD